MSRPLETLDQVLRRVLSVAVGGAILTAGCSSDPDSSPQSICQAGPPRSLWEAARVSAGLDFLGLRYAAPQPTFGSQAGELCSGATDRAACTSLAMSVPGDESFAGVGVVVATRGQEVFAVDSRSKAANVLHPEVPEVAALLALGFAAGGTESPSSLCDKVKYEKDGDSLIIRSEFTRRCGGGHEELRRATYRVGRDAQVTTLTSERITPDGGCVVFGRLHEGQPPFPGSGCDQRWLLMRAAYYERGSVDSFERLARELEAHGAPHSLVQRARAAANEERDHARVTSELARVRGGTELSAPPPAPAHVRTLEEVALENAVEGCVHETYAAVVALHQAAHARARDVRAAMTAIANDEVGHAALAWDVATWAEAKLHDDERRRVEAARQRACDELPAHAYDPSPDAHARVALGLPDAAAVALLAKELARVLGARERSFVA
jgi:hypothetical protein